MKNTEQTRLKWTLPVGYRGLIFDCDGTLVDSMPIHYQAWVTVLRRHNLELTETRFYQWAGTSIEEVIERLAAEKGLKVDAAAIGTERDEYFHDLAVDNLRPVRTVVDIARHYYGQLPMAVATGSTKESAEASLRAIGILELFDAVISSQEAGPPKPAPDVFLLAAKKIDVPAKECVVFEDGEAGFTAARAAGMLTVDIRPWLER